MITVPKSALSEPDDAGKMIDPSVGDMVDLGKAQAKVVSLDGDNVKLDIQTVNGQPATYCGEPDEDDGDMESMEDVDDPQTGMPMNKEGAALMAKAMASDKRKFGE